MVQAMQVNCLNAPFQESNMEISLKQKRLASPRNAENHRHNPKIAYQKPQLLSADLHIARHRKTARKSKLFIQAR
jgi:hypothetical protein